MNSKPQAYDVATAAATCQMNRLAKIQKHQFSHL